jgi:hypothetical protein
VAGRIGGSFRDLDHGEIAVGINNAALIWRELVTDPRTVWAIDHGEAATDVNS